MAHIINKTPAFDPSKQRKLDYGTLPNSPQDVSKLSPEEYQRKMDAMNRCTQDMYLASVTECLKGKHFPANGVFTCGHCTEQDEVHPDGMIFSPFKYYLCQRCYTRHMLRKLDLAFVLKMTCHLCVVDEWERIKKINPTKVKDFLKDAQAR